MAEQRKIIVRGSPRSDLDPKALLQVLLAAASQADGPSPSTPSPDVFEAAVEDRRLREPDR